MTDAINNDRYKDYLYDLGTLLKEMSMEAKEKASASNSPFDIGYMAGFHRVVSLMQQQAEGFGIPIAEVGLDGIDPDENLV